MVSEGLEESEKSNMIFQNFSFPSPLLGVTIIEETLFIVLEFCSKGSLLSWLRDEQGIEAPEHELLQIAMGASACVLFMEKKEFIHRDIAARNFLLMGNLEVKLSDFGMAKRSNNYYTKTNTPIPVRW